MSRIHPVFLMAPSPLLWFASVQRLLTTIVPRVPMNLSMFFQAVIHGEIPNALNCPMARSRFAMSICKSFSRLTLCPHISLRVVISRFRCAYSAGSLLTLIPTPIERAGIEMKLFAFFSAVSVGFSGKYLFV